MTFNTQQLILELKNYTNEHINFAKELKSISEVKLQAKINSKYWSVLECIEHLNLYAVFYNKEIQKRIETSNYKESSVFKSGFLGNKFSLDMLPKEGMKTMNTFKSKNPIHSNLNKEEVLDTFIKYQYEMLNLLKLSEENNLTKIKTSLTIPFLKFKLGNTLRFVIYHNERHIVQAKKALKNKSQQL